MSDKIKLAGKVWGPHPTAPNADVLLAVPGDVITAEQAEAWNVAADGHQARDGEPTPEPVPPADPPANDDQLPTPALIEAMTGPQLDELSTRYDLEIPKKMNVPDKKVAAIGAIEELALELAGMEGLEGLTEAEIDELAAQAEAAKTGE